MSLEPGVGLPRTDRDWVRWCRFALKFIKIGEGSPEGVVVADRGTLYLRTDGSTSTTLYVKTADDGEASGWAAK